MGWQNVRAQCREWLVESDKHLSSLFSFGRDQSVQLLAQAMLVVAPCLPKNFEAEPIDSRFPSRVEAGRFCLTLSDACLLVN
jgi:hypothetical protein